MEENYSEQELVRRNKLKDLRDKNINPYPSKTNRTAKIGDLQEKYKELENGAELDDQTSNKRGIRASDRLSTSYGKITQSCYKVLPRQ